MKVPCPPCPKPIAVCKKMRPPDNTGSEPVETSKKGKAGKAVVTTESSSKLAKASEALAQWKAEAAKTTLPPVATKPSKLMSVEDRGCKSSGRREREKKVHEVVPATVLEKKTPSEAEKEKGINTEGSQSEAAKPHEKRLWIDSTTQAADNVDVLAKPAVQLIGTYPPKAKEPSELKELPETAPVDQDLAELEARTEREQAYLSVACDPREHMKQTPTEKAVSKKFWEHYNKIGELCDPNFLTYEPDQAIVGLMDIINGVVETEKIDPQALWPQFPYIGTVLH